MAVSLDVGGGYVIHGNTDGSQPAAIVYIYTIKLFDYDANFDLSDIPAYEQDVYEIGKTKLIAPFNINAHRLVTLNPVAYYDKDTIGHAGKEIGFSLESVLISQEFRAQYSGEVHNPGWGLTVGALYFADNSGFITTTKPLTGFSQIVGIAKDSSTLLLNFKEAIILK